MKPIANLLTSIALFAAAPYAKAQAQGNGQPAALPAQNPATAEAAKHALHYGRKCILKKGSILAVSYGALAKLYNLAEKKDLEGIATMARKNLIDRIVADAIAVPIRSHGLAQAVEIHIPGYFGNVFTDRSSLDGDVQGYLTAH